MNVRAAFLGYRVIAITMVGALTFAAWSVTSSGQYVDLLVALLGSAGVVVTVFGIWIAVIFPRLLHL